MELDLIKEAIRDVIREEIAALLGPKSRAAADRQKRYRARKKEAMATVVVRKPRAKRGENDGELRNGDVTRRNSDVTHNVTGDVWGAYEAAYQQRYGVSPVRNATVNAQLKAFINRVGVTEAPAIAAWYVGSNVQRRVQGKHSAGLLLMEAEGIRTEWAMGRDVTATEAAQADKTQANGNVWNKLIGEANNG